MLNLRGGSFAFGVQPQLGQTYCCLWWRQQKKQTFPSVSPCTLHLQMECHQLMEWRQMAAETNPKGSCTCCSCSWRWTDLAEVVSNLRSTVVLESGWKPSVAPPTSTYLANPWQAQPSGPRPRGTCRTSIPRWHRSLTHRSVTHRLCRMIGFID